MNPFTKRPKYGNRRTTVGSLSFMSQKEANRYCDLDLLQRAGEIKELALQPRFKLTVNGKHVTTYVGDFQYLDKRGRLIVEDVKGFKTDVYKLKAALFEAIHGFPVTEV
jgi:hypothetical protein